jgi:hypothetical protein
MTEAELIAEVKRLASDPKRRTTMVQKFPSDLRLPKFCHTHPLDPLPQSATWEAVRAVEERLGFRLPVLLGKLWAEVANGGFGPGYGLVGIEGGYALDPTRLTLPELYFSMLDSYWEPVLDGPWPEKLVPICHWGCGHESLIDCSTIEGQIVDFPEGSDLRPKGVTFARWMEDWVNGVELWGVSH